MGALTPAVDPRGEPGGSALPWDLPALVGIEAFVALSEADGVETAALRLRIPPVVLARRVEALQRQLGTELFNHSSAGIELSAAGARYLAAIRVAFERLATATSELRQRGAVTPIVVSAPDYARQHWLEPLLPRLAEQFPDCRFECRAERAAVHDGLAAADLSICAGGSVGASLAGERLFPLYAFPVVAADRNEQPAHRLSFGFRDGDVWDAWRLRGGRLPLGDASQRDHQHATAAWRACAAGEGLSIGLWPWVQPWLDQGALRRLDDQMPIQVGEAYLVGRPRPSNQHRLSALHAWLRQALAGKARPLSLPAPIA